MVINGRSPTRSSSPAFAAAAIPMPSTRSCGATSRSFSATCAAISAMRNSPRTCSRRHSSASTRRAGAWRTARAATNRSRAGPSDRLVRARSGPGRPRRLSSLVRRAARDRHPQPLSGIGQKPPKPRERQTGTRSAQTQEKHHRRGMRGVLANRRRTADTPDLAAQGQSVSRKTVAEVPLTGLSFAFNMSGLGTLVDYWI